MRSVEIIIRSITCSTGTLTVQGNILRSPHHGLTWKILIKVLFGVMTKAVACSSGLIGPPHENISNRLIASVHQKQITCETRPKKEEKEGKGEKRSQS